MHFKYVIEIQNTYLVFLFIYSEEKKKDFVFIFSILCLRGGVKNQTCLGFVNQMLRDTIKI